MRVIAKRVLREFWKRYPDAEAALRAWHDAVEAAAWKSPVELKAVYGNASVVGNNRVVFNICGNKYRLVVRFNYAWQVAYTRFIGTHAQYDAIDVEKV